MDVKVKCRCGRECENEDTAQMSGWAFRETINGVVWSCNDCAIENMIDEQSGLNKAIKSGER